MLKKLFVIALSVHRFAVINILRVIHCLGEITSVTAILEGCINEMVLVIPHLKAYQSQSLIDSWDYQSSL